MSGLEGLGIVANVIAVVDLSLKVISWCSKYARDVKDSSDGRARLLQAAITLHYESEKIRHLLTGKNGSKLKASQKLAHAMGNSQVQLRELESLLSDKTNLSSLRWPLRKEKVESAIRNIENATKAFLEVLQIDTVKIQDPDADMLSSWASQIPPPSLTLGSCLHTIETSAVSLDAAGDMLAPDLLDGGQMRMASEALLKMGVHRAVLRGAGFYKRSGRLKPGGMAVCPKFVTP